LFCFFEQGINFKIENQSENDNSQYINNLKEDDSGTVMEEESGYVCLSFPAMPQTRRFLKFLVVS